MSVRTLTAISKPGTLMRANHIALERPHAPATQNLLRGAASEPARPIDEPLRRILSHSLGHDFSQVKVHSGPASSQAAERMGARAFTLGTGIHLGAEARGLPSPEFRRLLAHEAVHTVQQGGRPVAPHGGLKVSSPADSAEREAEHIARSVASPVPGRHSIHRVAPHIQRDLTGQRSVKDGGIWDLKLLKEIRESDKKTGLQGTIKFFPDDAQPDADTIRLLQVVRTEDLTTGKDVVWTGDEANRNKMMTTADKAMSIEPGYFVDHKAAVAAERAAKHRPVPPYYRAYGANERRSQDGSKSGKTVSEASLFDFAGATSNTRFSFETAAQATDGPKSGYTYGTLTWGFTISDAAKGIVDKEYADAHSTPSATFGAAVKKFTEFYKKLGAAPEP